MVCGVFFIFFICINLFIVLSFSPSFCFGCVCIKVFPWQVRVFGQTVAVSGNATDVRRAFVPAASPQKPSVLHVWLQLPAGGAAEISLDLAPQLLTLEQYPPDPHRGVDLRPAELLVHEDARSYRMYASFARKKTKKKKKRKKTNEEQRKEEYGKSDKRRGGETLE